MKSAKFTKEIKIKKILTQNFSEIHDKSNSVLIGITVENFELQMRISKIRIYIFKTQPNGKFYRFAWPNKFVAFQNSHIIVRIIQIQTKILFFKRNFLIQTKILFFLLS